MDAQALRVTSRSQVALPPEEQRLTSAIDLAVARLLGLPDEPAAVAALAPRQRPTLVIAIDEQPFGTPAG